MWYDNMTTDHGAPISLHLAEEGAADVLAKEFGEGTQELQKYLCERIRKVHLDDTLPVRVLVSKRGILILGEEARLKVQAAIGDTADTLLSNAPLMRAVAETIFQADVNFDCTMCPLPCRRRPDQAAFNKARFRAFLWSTTGITLPA